MPGDTVRDLALLKAVMVAGPAMDAAERDTILADLSSPARPELLALEQKAVAPDRRGPGTTPSP